MHKLNAEIGWKIYFNKRCKFNWHRAENTLHQNKHFLTKVRSFLHLFFTSVLQKTQIQKTWVNIFISNEGTQILTVDFTEVD